MESNSKKWFVGICLGVAVVFMANCASGVSVTAQNTTRPVLLGKIRNIKGDKFAGKQRGNIIIVSKNMSSQSHNTVTTVIEGPAKVDKELGAVMYAPEQSPVVEEILAIGQVLLSDTVYRKSEISVQGNFYHE